VSSFIWIIVIVSALTLIGTLALAIVTLKYYWGERGAPPLTGEERRQQKEAELRLRASQIEYAKRHPVTPRKPEFWDNSKAAAHRDTTSKRSS